ncbi:hypothetical protein DTO013E5_3983 [Penicillium roqueforti]|uniref:uncharacterized protein n=1 Tax=Penicillium roqueforti TaxID=5082 RepID=UPI00190CDDC7|nr:uncharacterized protein LCP9604111_1586 [Penicillium roqueforti]KAF9251590.1 hypothetical protein LCP9604111_1586 [Penicillium roqueforti]KAI1836597.1 hypothetical protein CBS147337_2824 [Penicillium roqueforti]KAI2685265.1 hypothetical protein LCP963914a_4592 [Penicillium roqueforti]KAI2690389.1 hypothetical protein CBS147355_840 [Penicillium roqueforti]KAI2695637.1 hypothetical protein CBS147372_9054 [Penicillium roqueforti]
MCDEFALFKARAWGARPRRRLNINLSRNQPSQDPIRDWRSVNKQQPFPAHIMAGNSSHPIHIHPVRPLYRFTATALGASMWFFLMYRAKKDGPALLGWKHPWDH